MAKLLAVIFDRFRLPALTAEILVGVLLGPSLLGRVAPDAFHALFPADPVQQNMLETMSQIGILFLLLVTGLEINFQAVWKHRTKGLKLTIVDVVLPLLMTSVLIFFLPEVYFAAPQVALPLSGSQRILVTVFLAAIMAISALPVALRAMHDLNLLKTDMGLVAMTALSIHDIIGWVVFTIILGVFSQGQANLGLILQMIAATLAFTIIALTVGRRWMDRLLGFLFRNRTDSTALSLSLLFITGLAFGALTMAIGIHSLFGFFLAGLVCGESRQFTEKNRASISQFVLAVFVPFFFMNIGLKLDIVANFDWFLVLFFVVVGSVARFAASYVGAWWGRVPHAERIPLGILNMPGGAMHIVIATLALNAGLISSQVFVAIVFAAILSSVALGPLLSAALPRALKGKEADRRVITELPYMAVRRKAEALQLLAGLAAKKLNLPPEPLHEALVEREEVMSTAWEKGIAVPHVRIDSLERPVILFARCRDGVDWDAVDGEPVQLVFMLLTPAGQEGAHLQILRAIALMLAKENRRETLLLSEDRAALESILQEFLKSPV
jgi:Kef-type K+ transport system membrane component KefB/mannitol/fructose-specific phosphotransferase system IIA component (Ntr-type)